MSGALPLERARRAWASEYAGLSQSEVDQRVRGFGAMVRGIAGDGHVSVSRFAEVVGMEIPEAKRLFEALAAVGMQVDERGNVVGAALTALETPHVLRLADRVLYAWCALDTLFLPGLLGERAEIESTCPVSGETVRLTLSPDRIESADPSSLWLSVFLPGGHGRSLGPASPT